MIEYIHEDLTVAVSLTYDGVIYGTEQWNLYGTAFDYNSRFMLRRLGYVNDWVGFRLRIVSPSRVAFGLMTLEYS